MRPSCSGFACSSGASFVPLQIYRYLQIVKFGLLFSEPILTKFQLVSASPNWYSNVGHTNRLDYQDSPIQWHPNPMYSGVMEDMDPRSMDYGLTELPSAQPTMIINTAASVQQRSISRFGQHHFWKYGLLSFKLKDKIIRYIFG